MSLADGTPSTNSLLDSSSQNQSSLDTSKSGSADTLGAHSLIKFSLTSDDYLDQFVPIIRSELQSKDNLSDLILNIETVTNEKQDTLQGVSFNSVDDVTDSVDRIRKITHSSSELAKNLDAMNKQLGITGKSFAEERKNAVKYKRLNSKIDQTSSTINSCLEMLERANKVLELIRRKEFFKALANLQLLAGTDFEEVEQFDFGVRIYQSISTFRHMIIEETFNQLLKWLNLSMEKKLSDIGENLFDNHKRIIDSWMKKQRNDKSLLAFKVNSPIEKTLREEVLRNFDPLSNEAIHVDISPLYQSILVFEAVDKIDKLKEDFGNEMLRRRDRLIYPINEALANNNLDVLSSMESMTILIYSLSAFFVSDRYLSRKTTFRIRSSKQTDSLFDSVVSKFTVLLKRYIQTKITDVKQALQLLDIIGCFMQIMDSWDFDTDRLYDVLIDLFKVYITLSVSNFQKEYMDLSLDDDSQPITVDTPKQLSGIKDSCFYELANLDLEFPVTLPYSIIYPGACLRLRTFIHGLYVFLETYYAKRLDILSQMISRAVDKVLVDVILKDLDNKVHSSYKEEVSQNLINLEFFSNSVEGVEKYLNHSTDSAILRTRTPSNQVKLHAQVQFKEIRKRAEAGMFSMVDGKVDMLFEMVDFEWDSSSMNDEPSIGIKDMGLYLENMFKLDFSHLPYSMRTLLLKRSFEKITTHMKNSIFDADIITTEAIGNFELDIKYIESLIPELIVAGGDVDSHKVDSDKSNKELENMFVTLKEIISLLKDGNSQAVPNEEVKASKCKLIKPKEAEILLSKLRNYQPKSATSPRGTLSSEGRSSTFSEDVVNEPSRSLLSELKRSATTASFSGFSFKKNRE